MKVSITYHGMQASGRNLTEAKRAAGAKIADILSDMAPRLVAHPDKMQLAVIFRNPSGDWSYRRMDRPEHARMDLGCTCGGFSTAADAERAARKHMAQCAYIYGGDNGAAWVENQEDMVEHLRWVKWQDRHADARAAGADDETAREWANGRLAVTGAGVRLTLAEFVAGVR